MIRETPAIRERVNQLRTKVVGILAPSDVIEDARQASSPLHHLFEWDEKKAAYKHWIDTAREIIACVNIEITTHKSTFKVGRYVHTQGQTPGYEDIVKIRDNRDLAMEVLTQEFQCVANALRRARETAIALGLESEIDGLMKLVSAREVVIIRRAQLARHRRVPAPPRKSRRASAEVS